MQKTVDRRVIARLCPLIAAVLTVAFLAAPVAAADKPLALTGQLSPDKTRLSLIWPAQKAATIQLFRRELGQSGIESWSKRPATRISAGQVLDTGLKSGIAYEYQLRLSAPGGAMVGEWVTGQDVPAAPFSGRLILVVDETVRDSIAPALDRFALDLTGAGWTVERIPGPRSTGNRAEDIVLGLKLRQQIASIYHRDPFSPHALILLGHLPVIHSGWANPDGHNGQPQPTDLFFADPFGEWPATTQPDGKPKLRPSTLPADHIRMPVGRIDFADMPPQLGSEAELLNAYLERDTRWRHAQQTPVDRAYSSGGHLQVEQNGIVNIVGPAAMISAGHHDSTGRGPFLFGADFGSRKSVDYLEKPLDGAVFAINFGSGKQLFDRRGNLMRLLLAAAPVTLTVAWGGRPSWRLHGMALGETIGDAQMRTVNNGAASKGMASRDYPVTGHYDWVNPVWVNLLGDPTLTAFPLAPVKDVTARREDGGVMLGWTLPEGAQSANIYRAKAQLGPYVLMAADAAGDSFTDPAPLDGGWYMVRAKGLAQVHAGSFWRLAQGVFVQAP